jgi:hypothetical protein
MEMSPVAGEKRLKRTEFRRRDREERSDEATQGDFL